MTTLFSALSSSHRPQTAEFRKYAYIANGWDNMQRWDGRGTATETAGITGPSQQTDSWQPAPTTGAGDTDVGIHVFRYRYMDSRTGYVSNPSEEREYEVASAAEELTFPINTSGAANIIRSTDTKVDTIVIEMTTLGQDVFYTAVTVLNSASSVVVDISDATLETKFLPYPDDGHDPPPVAKNVVSHRERMWLFTQVSHETGNADFTNSSANVGEGSTDPDWRTSVLGSSSAARGDAAPWFILKDGDTTAYEVDYYDSAGTQLVLKENYGGTTSTNSAYKLFTRANVIWISNPDFPEGFTPLKFLNGPQSQSSGDITAGAGFGAGMLFFSQSGMFKLLWDQGPLVDPQMIPISTEYGALNNQVVVKVGQQIYSMDHRGFTMYQGLMPNFISRPVDDLMSLIDFSLSENFHAVFFPDLRAIRWFVVYTSENTTNSTDGSDYPRRYIQYDLDTRTWSTGRYLQGISSSKLIPTATGLKVLYGDENGHTWFADQGVCDGCYAGASHLTALSGSATVINTAGSTLPTANTGLVGCYLYNKSVEEYRLITANTVNSITVGTAFTVAPANGDTLWVGPIPTKLKTRSFAPRAFKSKFRVARMWVAFTPTSSARYLRLRLYEDLSSTAKNWAQSRNDLDGLQWPGNDSDYAPNEFLLDMSEADGNTMVPIGAEFKRWFDVELEIWEPDAALEIVGLQFEGTDLESVQ